MKKTVLLIIVFACFLSNVYGQACGGSVRTIQFDFEDGAKKPAKIYYRLFYLMPKRDDRYLDTKQTWESFANDQAVFLSKFLLDNPKPPNKYFWIAPDADSQFIEVPKIKAETYAYGYIGEKAGYDLKAAHKLKDFEGLWSDNILSQLWGNTCNTKLELLTSETSQTTFLMQISAEGFETLYFASNFLGGCFEGRDRGVYIIQHIKMRESKK